MRKSTCQDRIKRFRFTLLTFCAVVLTLAGCGGGSDDLVAPPSSGTVAPLALPGPYPVACSNVAQDFDRVPPGGEGAEDFWEGKPANGTQRYVTDLLTDPANVLIATVNAPNDTNLFGSYAGLAIDSVVLVCYPTTADNARPDFALPTGAVVPRMQIGTEGPLLADPAMRYPVIAFSHGFAASPLSQDHLDVLLWLASFGYVVAAPFHGDPRFANLQIDDFGDAVALVTNLSDVVAMQALRPLAMSATLDLVLSHPQWRDYVEPSQIGGFGASMGGETMMLLGGAALTSSPALSSTAVGTDRRVKAAVGYVPYFGQPLLPAFGRDQSGLDSVTLPYLAISGTTDTTAPLSVAREGLRRVQGPRLLVALTGVDHGFDAASANDILTWSVTFLDALVRDLPAARAQLSAMTGVSGGGDDRIVVPLADPLSP